MRKGIEYEESIMCIKERETTLPFSTQVWEVDKAGEESGKVMQRSLCGL